MNAIDSISAKILSNAIDKQEALRSFERLSEAQKKQLISKLMVKLSDNDEFNKRIVSEKNGNPPLRALHDRNLEENHKKFINKLAQDLEKFAPKSKENASKYQSCFVDQRKTGGLKKCLKPLQFHLTYEKGDGPYLYDIDGNKYVDIAGDNGVNLFGHQPEFIKKTIENRLNKGYPLVGYTEELFEAAKLFCELTGHDRVLFTQSGTEAVMWACRIARAATQKKKIVIFDGAFHGLSDAVLAAKDQFGNSMAMGLGMLQEFADQLIVLDYGKMDQLDIIENRCNEIAGILVEPVQSRNPSNQPAEFLKELRKLTLEKEIPLIFDEMITGFRICIKGAEGYFNIKADIATYGKIPGGGMPTGMVAGSAKYMNFVDGGAFHYDDDTMPSARKSLMAGTHTRNPIKIVACLAALTELKRICPGGTDCDSGSCLLNQLNEKTKRMVEEINIFFSEKRVPVVIDDFGSLFRIRFLDDPFGMTKELLLILLRMNGVETSPSGNCFLTLTHSDEDIASIIKAMKESINTLIKENFFYESAIIESEKQNEVMQETANTDRRSSREIASKGNGQIEKLRNLITADLKSFVANGGATWR